MPRPRVRPPGEVILEDFVPRLPPELRDQSAVARRLGISRQRWNEILNGRRAITPDTALRLGRFFGELPDYWMELQARWELRQELRSRRKRAEIDWIRPAPLAPATEAWPEGRWRGAAESRPEELSMRLAAEVIAARPAESSRGAGMERFFEEFLDRRGLLAEARRYVKIRAQLEAVDPAGRPTLPLSANFSLPLFTTAK